MIARAGRLDHGSQGVLLALGPAVEEHGQQGKQDREQKRESGGHWRPRTGQQCRDPFAQIVLSPIAVHLSAALFHIPEGPFPPHHRWS